MDGEQSTPPTTLPDGTANMETDKQVGRQTRDIYVGRVSGETKRGDKNKRGRGERHETVNSFGHLLKHEGWY